MSASYGSQPSRMKLAMSAEKAADAVRQRPAATLVVLWVIAVLPWLTWNRTIPYDAKDEFYPGVAFTAKSILRGEAPWWNPYLFSGYPSFADPQAMTFSPSVVLPMLVSQSIVWFDIVILAHVLLGGLGVLRLGRSYGWNSSSSLVAALVFMFGGVAASRLEHTPIIVTWAFLPWVFVSIRALCESWSWRAVAGLGLALGLGALQLTQATYLFLLVILAYSLYRVIDIALAEGNSRALGLAAHLTAGAGIALLVAAPQLVATLNVLPYSNRGRFELAALAANYLSPQAYLTLLSPSILGNLRGEYHGPNDITETYLYIGTFPLVLVIVGLVGLRRGPDRGEAWFWTSALLFSIVYALGTATPIFALLHRFLPGVAYFRRTSEAAFLFLFCIAILAGRGMESAEAGRAGAGARAPGVRSLGAVVGLVALAALASSAWHGTWPSPVSIALLGLGFWCFARMRTGPASGLWSAALLVSIFVDLRIHNVANRLNAHRPSEYLGSASLEHNPALRFLDQRLREEGRYRVELRTGASDLNAPETMGIESIGGLNPLVVQDYVAFVGLSSEALLPRSPSGAFDSYRGRVNDLLGVRYLVATNALRPTIEKDLGSAYKVVGEPDGRVVWQNQNALPRVLRPSRAIAAPPVSAFTPDTLDSIDLEDSAYVEATSSVLARCAGGRAERADIVRYSNNEVILAVEADHAAWIALNDVFFEGWRAEIDGESTGIYRANGIFRAVCVPPGRHAVRFVFEPYRHIAGKLWTAIHP
jgi:hypothetical protein